MPPSLDLARQRAELERDIPAIDASRARSLYNKTKLLQHAGDALAQRISTDVLEKVVRAAGDHFHAEHQRLLKEARAISQSVEIREWDVLDGVELGDCGDKAMEMAIELGINDPAILDLIYELGMRAADFCFAGEEQILNY